VAWRPFPGKADPEYFKKLKHPHAIGEHFRLPGAKTVISFFLPFSEAVKKGNRKDKNWPSPEWLHGRIEGQAFVQKLCRYLQSVLGDEGYASVVPALDPDSGRTPIARSTKPNSPAIGRNDMWLSCAGWVPSGFRKA